MLAVSLLGTPTLTLDRRPLSVNRRKSRALLYYLAAHSAPLNRESLLTFFWPDLDRPAAQQTLRTTLHGLRKALGPALLVEDDTIALAPDTYIDTRAFESAIQPPNHLTTQLSNYPATQLRDALALYRGDFLSGFTLPDAPTFDDWAAAERERFRRLAVRGLTTLSQLHEADGNFSAALEALDRALAFDSLQEDLQRNAMRLHYLAGDRAGAIRRYDSLRKLLEEEMGVPPMPETRQVYDTIINDKIEVGNQKIEIRKAVSDLRSQPPNHLAARLPFVGREAELQTLRTAAHTRRFALIEGEPGIGKTRLAEEFIAASSAVALIAAAHELEQTIPYQPIIQALRALCGRPDWPALQYTARANLAPVWQAEVSRILPELGPESDSRQAQTPADESRLWEGVHQLLSALSTVRPIILFLDDLQWADTSTLALLGYLTRQSTASITVVAATRPVPPRSPLASLLQTLTREERLTRVALRRLSHDDIAAIAHSLSSLYAAPLAEWLARAAEGNPYVLAELVRFARENDLIRSDGQVNLSALSISPPVPHTVYSLIQSRLNRLSNPARRVLDAAVAAGREFEFEIVYRAAGLSETAALNALDELRAAALIYPRPGDSTGRHFIFDHPLTMEVAYREVGETRHRILHRRVAETLETLHARRRLDSVAALIASHFAEGNAPDRAAPYAFRAAQLAAQIAAWREAIAFYEQALEGEANDDRRYNILMALGEASFNGGAAAQSTDAFRRAIELAPPGTLEAACAQIGLARSLLTQARFAEIIEVMKKVRVDERPELAAQAAFIWGTALSIEGADLAAATEHLQKADTLLSQPNAPPDPATRAQIKFEMGSVVAQQGDLPRAIGLYRESLSIAESAPPETAIVQRILAHNNIAYHLHLIGDPSASEHARTGLALAQEKGMLTLQPFLFSTLGEIALAAEDFETAERHFEEGLAIAERLNIPERIAGITANLGLLARALGQNDLAIHRLSTALARADSLGLRHLSAQIRLWLAPLLPLAEARAYLAEARAIAESSGRKKLLEAAQYLEHSLLTDY